MTNKERWTGWYLVQSGTTQYLGRGCPAHDMVEEEARMRLFYLRPCVKIIEQYPVFPDPKGQPVIMPVMSFVTIGMFQTDDIPQQVWADAWIDLSTCHEDQLQRYSDGYDHMLQQVRSNLEKEHRRASTIALPGADDVSKFGATR